MSSKGLLAVSFGTSVEETRERTIGAIENSLAQAFPDRKVYRAWTSGVIRRKLLKTQGMEIDSVEQALERMIGEGVRDLLVQPTHLLDGEENRLMTEAIMAKADRFESVRIGAPLLATREDILTLAGAVDVICPELKGDELFAWMGHGSSALQTNVYDVLNDIYAQGGKENVHVGTVEFDPGFAPVEEFIRTRHPKRAFLAPLMVVAGDHAVNDMAGDEPDSWRSMVEAMGVECVCILKGLGEYELVRDLCVKHAREAKPV